MTPKIRRFLAGNGVTSPILVVDLDVIERNYRRLRDLLPHAKVFYAVKANPARPVLDRLAGLGSSFDAASLSEVETCLDTGAGADRISYGNTIKKQADIARAFDLGVRLFAFDSEPELRKIAASAPGSRVYCRIALKGTGAHWPLSRKFGCSLDMARDLMLMAADQGLDPHGLSFHVGSQQCNIDQWEVAIGRSAMVFSDLADRGVELKLLNLGGGYPTRYRHDVPSLDNIAETIHAALVKHFGNRMPDLLMEPGRAIAADAGVLRSEVVLVSYRDYTGGPRWVYLDVGTFGGLAETQNDAIEYRFRTSRDGMETGPVMLAGPTCDGADILYENAAYDMPLSLQAGDTVDIQAAGAYTTTYSSVGFNGFAPLQAHYI